MLDVCVVWLHRDLRLHDNPALSAALLTSKKVVLAYVWAPKEEGQFQPGRASRWWLYHSLSALEKQVEARGSFVCYREGPCAVDQLLDICREVSASVVFFNNVYDPLSLVRDHEVKRQLSNAGIVARSFNGELLFEPWAVLDERGLPFTTFEGFWNKATSGTHAPAAPSFVEPSVIPSVDCPALRRVSLNDLGLISPSERWAHAHFSDKWTPGTKAGLMLLVDFLDNRLPAFDADRAKIDRDSTSRLSPYIHFGEVSIRVIYHEVMKREAANLATNPHRTAVTTFLQQLGYREYSRYLSFHFPFTHERSLLEHVRAVPWVHCPVRFKAWRQGMTGYPIVDAAMRQLWVTGWMHNRARVFTASFLVKNLLLPWQWGLKHFWDMLLDADLECDALGWQYVAGCLRDAHPFTYMMDFELESKRFDPDGAFVRKWVPELAQMPLQYVHRPWEAPEKVLREAGIVLGASYPSPIISLSESRAAVDHAYGIVQKCIYVRNLKPEPYQFPTVPIEMKLLQPEEEVDQILCRKGMRHSTHSNTSNAVALQGWRFQTPKAVQTAPGIVLRHEAIPPSCILPELPDCNLQQSPAMQDLTCKASCGHSGGAAPCEELYEEGANNTSTGGEGGNASSQSQARMGGFPSSSAVSGTNHPAQGLPPPACSHAESGGQPSGQLSGVCSKAGGRRDACMSAVDDPRGHTRAAGTSGEQHPKSSSSAMQLDAKLVGVFAQVSTAGSLREEAPAQASARALWQSDPNENYDGRCNKRNREVLEAGERDCWT